MPELMDLDQGVYVSEKGTEMAQSTKESLSKRPNRHMMDEARYTDRHIERTMKQPLRKRPIEFVKAKEVYDPSKDLIEKIMNYNKNGKSLSDHMESLEVKDADESIELPDIEQSQQSVDLTNAHSEGETKIIADELIQPETKSFETHHTREEILDENHEADSNEGIENDEEEDVEEVTHDKSHQEDEEDEGDGNIEEIELVEKDEEENDVTDEIEDIKVGVINAKEDIIENDEIMEGEEYVEKLKKSYAAEENDILTERAQIYLSESEHTIESESDDDVDQDDMFVIDEEGDNNVLNTHGVQKKQFFDVISQRPEKRDQEIKDFHTTEAPKAFLQHDPHITVGHVMLTTRTENGSVEASLPTLNHLNDVTTKGFVDLATDNNKDLSDDTDDEAAFEDYMAQLMETNNMSDSESNYCSDASFDPFDEEGIKAMVTFAGHKNNFSQLDFSPTQSIKKKGKGRKQAPQFLVDVEMELRESLLEQYHYQKQSRRDKKLRKKEEKKQNALVNNDLSMKYDYSIHIKEMEEEFSMFLQDESRDTMSFPPLDPHGNKTINKLAHCYNMRCTKNGGNGLHMYMKVAKHRKTFHNLPDFNLISSIMGQRPIFKRSDVKSRTKDEIAQSDGKKLRRGPQSEAHVQEGDIVGAKAPEIASNNIGRQLLEKLGWVKGEGLGPNGNKGINEPLMATVKKSKTGLR